MNRIDNNQKSFTSEEKEKMIELLIEDYFNQEQKDKWNKILADKHHIYLPPKKRAKQFSLYRRLAVAAVLLILILGGNFYSNYTKSTRLVNQDLGQHFSQSNKKGIDQNAGKIAQGFEYYNEEDYEKAIKIFKNIIQSGNGTRDVYFYLALSYLYLDNAEKAVNNFKKARNLPNSAELDTNQEINWYLCLAYFKAKDKENTIKELKNFRKKNYGFKETQSKQLLDSL